MPARSCGRMPRWGDAPLQFATPETAVHHDAGGGGADQQGVAGRSRCRASRIPSRACPRGSAWPRSRAWRAPTTGCDLISPSTNSASPSSKSSPSSRRTPSPPPGRRHLSPRGNCARSRDSRPRRRRPTGSGGERKPFFSSSSGAAPGAGSTPAPPSSARCLRVSYFTKAHAGAAVQVLDRQVGALERAPERCPGAVEGQPQIDDRLTAWRRAPGRPCSRC